MDTLISNHADTAILYVLHSGQLFGTERMAIATLRRLGAGFDSLLLAPPGLAINHARDAGLTAAPFTGYASLLLAMGRFLRGRRSATLVATGVSQSFAACILSILMGVRLKHLHIVHGGTDERLSYGRKKWLLPLAVSFVAVSAFVRQRLIAHGVSAQRIVVMENFLSREAQPATRGAFSAGIEQAVMVSRLDPIKRVDLLLDALQSCAELRRLPVRVLGTGWEEQALRERAARNGLAVEFAGFSSAVPQALALSDLLIHTCPEEPFGLAILEAMAAGIPVLVPDCGGPSEFIRDGENGYVYRANDAMHLAQRLLEVCQSPPGELNRIVAAAHATLQQRFSPERRMTDYRHLFTESSR